MPVPGLSHAIRQVLFLPLDTAGLLRSAPQLRLGLDTEEVTKLQFGVDVDAASGLEYVASRPEWSTFSSRAGMSRNCAMSR